MSPSVRWNTDFALLAALGCYLALYIWRWRRARIEAGAHAASGWRLASFVGGLVVLFIALGSPIDGLGEQLFVFHMAQHVLLADFAAVLLLLGLTKVILRPLTARLVRVEAAAGPLAHPAAAVAIYVGVLWAWHLPALYEAGLEHPAVHLLQHTTLLGAALLFWWHLLGPIRARHPITGMGVVFYIVAAKAFTGLLASVLTWAPIFFYDYYARQPRYWGLSAREDQSLAGALMMAADSLVLTTAVVVLFVRMLDDSEREAQRAERYET